METKSEDNTDFISGNIKAAPYIIVITSIIGISGLFMGVINFQHILILALVAVLMSIGLYFQWARNNLLVFFLNIFIPIQVLEYLFGNKETYTYFSDIAGFSIILCIVFSILLMFKEKFLSHAENSQNA